jgi:putative DNA primase/helicase
MSAKLKKKLAKRAASTAKTSQAWVDPTVVAFQTARQAAPPQGLLKPWLPTRSEEALALEFIDWHEHKIRYVAGWGKWMLFHGKRWQADEKQHTFSLVREICRRAASEAHSSVEASAKTVAAVERLAKADQRTASTVDQWDADPWSLNTPAGIVDLHTGDIRPIKSTDYVTKITAVGPSGDCPIWRDCIRRWTANNDDLAKYLQKIAGYFLTGSTQEEELYFFYGEGGNGKTKFVEAIAGILHDYTRTASASTFTIRRNEQHTTELARLQGARLVTATETEEGQRWAESLIKRLTGGEKITARFMRQDDFEFTPQFKLLVSGNHKPKLYSVDEAIRRRLRLVPFEVTIPKDQQDRQLPLKLRLEWPGILQWLIEGCLMWQREGLKPPSMVERATEKYFEDEDIFSHWVVEDCERDPNAKTASWEASNRWQGWAKGERAFVGDSRFFKRKMEAAGFTYRHTKQGSFYFGVRLKTQKSPV